MLSEEMRLDGNAAGGMLREVFADDVTVAIAQCAGCGRSSAIGTLLEYGDGMGVVLRCAGCSSAVLRIVRTPASPGSPGSPGSLYVDFTGVTRVIMSGRA
jgi:hypothetical protein